MIEAAANFHFIRPAWLLAAPIIVGLWWLWQRQTDPLRGWRDQIDPTLLSALVVHHGAAHRRAAIGSLAPWLLAVVAVAGPTWRLEPAPFAENASPLIILLKADESMSRPDPLPSRLERAQLKIADLAELWKGQPLGLIAYAGSAHLVLPPTTDTTVVTQLADEISPAVMPVPGDRLDLAIRKAGEVLAAHEDGGSVLVVADSVEGDPHAAASEYQSAGKFAIQFLALADAESTDSETVREAARSLNATVRQLATDDSDVVAIARAASRTSAGGVGGESGRWQEAGYWLVPLIGLMLAAGFRRETLTTAETQV